MFMQHPLLNQIAAIDGAKQDKVCSIITALAGSAEGLIDLVRVVANLCDHKNKPVNQMLSWVISAGGMTRVTPGMIE